MKEEQLLERIVLNPKVMIGKPVIRGTRLTVDFILNLLAHGATENEILNEYKGLTIEDKWRNPSNDYLYFLSSSLLFLFLALFIITMRTVCLMMIVLFVRLSLIIEFF